MRFYTYEYSGNEYSRLKRGYAIFEGKKTTYPKFKNLVITCGGWGKYRNPNGSSGSEIFGITDTLTWKTPTRGSYVNNFKSSNYWINDGVSAAFGVSIEFEYKVSRNSSWKKKSKQFSKGGGPSFSWSRGPGAR